MNKKIYLLPILLLMLVFTSCEETKEVSIYDNWQSRNEAFIDSLYDVYTKKPDHGGLDSIHLLTAPNDYIFFKRKTPVTDTPSPNNPYEYIEGYVSEDMQPYYTDSVYMYYKGSLIIKQRFDGFKGINPTVFDSPSRNYVRYYVTGITEILQRMTVGERWEIYVPWKYGYLAKGSDDGTIPGYSTLIFDMQLYSIENRSSNMLLIVEDQLKEVK